jgi:hypothetical protein
LIAWFYKVRGLFQGYMMAIRLNAGEFASILAGILALLLELMLGIAGVDDEATSSLVLLIAIFAILIPAVKQTVQFVRNQESWHIAGSRAYHDEVIEKMRLSRTYRENGYSIREFDNGKSVEYYVASNLVDTILLEGDISRDRYGVEDNDSSEAPAPIPIVFRKGRFHVPSEVRPLVFEIVRNMFKRNPGRRLFNGRLMRMCSDILPNDWNEPLVVVQQVRYFDGQCTHEIVFKKAPRSDKLNETFFGEALMLDGDNCLLSLWDSRCGNYIGASTLAITSDRKMLLGIQGGKSMANANRFAPSGSGSVEFSDCRHCRRNPDGTITLQDLIRFAAERELKEETTLSDCVKVRTFIIGFARLIERGGKPDFFALSFVDATYDEIVSDFEKEACHQRAWSEQSPGWGGDSTRPNAFRGSKGISGNSHGGF